MKAINLKALPVVIVLLFVISLSGLEAKDPGEGPSLKGKKVLFVWGGWNGHEPEQCRDIFVPWLESEGAEVIVSDSLGIYTDEEFMASLDLVVQAWTMGQISGEQEQGLLKAVKSGVGLAGGVIDYHVDVIDKKDYVTSGLQDFDMHSEQYYMHVDPNVNVLVTTTFSGDHAPWIDGAVMPVVWKKSYGEGRVFYNSLGHVAADFEVDEALKIMKRGIRWASESKYAGREEWLRPVY
jgi:type 1 glutamine amidotransferase